ncbi:glutaconate CoA-transferase [Acidobacteriia bacterium AH_259_A11_L15]|nr:glutaconate CoA-transferase [Acidobacteriia bacterium AH_259_A11_L15]
MRKPSRADFLVLSMARAISNGATVATGVFSWLPMLAIAVARATRAPHLVYLNCAGAIDPPLLALPLTSTDIRLLKNNPYTLRLADLWEFAARGRLDVMFFGFAQLDRNGNTNLTLLRGSNGHVRKLPGVAGASALRQLVKNPVLFSVRHSPAAFVRRLDAVTTVARHQPVRVVTDLGIFQVARGKLQVLSLHSPASLYEVREKTGFVVEPPSRLRYTLPPSRREWRALEKLDPRKIRNRHVQL